MTDHPLSILHFSTADNEGGSGRAAYRIHTGIRSLGYISRMLVGQKVTADPDVDTVYKGNVGRMWDMVTEKVTQRLGLQYLYIPSSRRVLRHSWRRKADVIQLYNIHGGYFSHRILPALSKRAPIVWRLSDMWPMTTHAAYSYGCLCYKEGPSVCRCDLSLYPPLGRDTRALLWNRKERIYQRSDITVVAPSHWIEQIARESLLLGRFPVRYIPNGLDLQLFRPRDRIMCRAMLDVKKDARIILFTAHSLDDNNPRKGAPLLKEALRKLGHLPNTLLLLAGVGGAHFANDIPIPVHHLGYIRDDRLMTIAYNAADFIVAPSVVENLPNNILEAIACGIPAVAFDTGGIADAVQHGETGYLARHGDVVDLAKGIRELFEDTRNCQRMGHRGRELAEGEFSQELQIRRFADLYQEVYQRRASSHSRQFFSR